jgi:sugar lactone lactonase YvrE
MSFFDAVDPGFNRFVMGNAPLQNLATGFDWVEGPVWFGDANCLLFSDIPNNRIMRWIPGQPVSVYREPSGFSNGIVRSTEGLAARRRRSSHARCKVSRINKLPAERCADSREQLVSAVSGLDISKV